MAYRYRIKYESTLTGALNPSYNVLAFGDAGAPDDQSAAQVIAYGCQALFQASTSDSTVVGLDVETVPGSGVWLPVAFPYGAWASLAPQWSAYAGGPQGVSIGFEYGDLLFNFPGKDPSGRGDSICVNTRGLGVGRHGSGRHYLPFTTKAVVGLDGLIVPITVANMNDSYQVLLQDREGFSAARDLLPSVYSPSLGTMAVVVSNAVSNVPSRLRSRLR